MSIDNNNNRDIDSNEVISKNKYKIIIVYIQYLYVCVLFPQNPVGVDLHKHVLGNAL